ncbi:hypothetical protein Rctr85_045 [Virus Rctr85]|nr:hypothetical protein Rctr85_045 [Virus Rctr85]
MTIHDNEHDLQEKCRNLVAREVYVCQSSLVDAMLQQGVFLWEDIENWEQPCVESDLRYGFEDEWEVYEWATEYAPATFVDYLRMANCPLPLQVSDENLLLSMFERDYDIFMQISEAILNIDISRETIDTFADYLEHIENVDRDALYESREIFEWWVVSDWLERRLREQGCPFLVNDYGTWWGRQTSGQMIAADDAIREIVKSLKY